MTGSTKKNISTTEKTRTNPEGKKNATGRGPNAIDQTGKGETEAKGIATEIMTDETRTGQVIVIGNIADEMIVALTKKIPTLNKEERSKKCER